MKAFLRPMEGEDFDEEAPGYDYWSMFTGWFRDVGLLQQGNIPMVNGASQVLSSRGWHNSLRLAYMTKDGQYHFFLPTFKAQYAGKGSRETPKAKEIQTAFIKATHEGFTAAKMEWRAVPREFLRFQHCLF